MSDFIDHANSPAAQETEAGANFDTNNCDLVLSEHSSMNKNDDSSSFYNVSSRMGDFNTPQGGRIDIANTDDGAAETNATTVALDRTKRRANLEAKRAKLTAQIKFDEDQKQ